MVIVTGKLSQYADNTTLILDGSNSSFARTIHLLHAFGSVLGLKANYEKTEALWIGSLQNSNTNFPSSKPRTWANGKVCALAVWFLAEEINSSLINILEKTDKLTKSIGSWSATKTHSFRCK